MSSPYKERLALNLWCQDYPTGTAVAVPAPDGSVTQACTAGAPWFDQERQQAMLPLTDGRAVPLRNCRVLHPVTTAAAKLDDCNYDLDARRPCAG